MRFDLAAAALLILAATSMTAILGCAKWKRDPTGESPLVPPRADPSTAVIDIAFVPIPYENDAIDWHM